MSTLHPLQAAIDQVGLQQLANALGVTYVAMRKWQAAGRMPRTEWTGETQYVEKIVALCPGLVTREQLLAPWPKFEGKRRIQVTEQVAA